MSYRLAYIVVTVVAVALTYAAMVAMADSTSPWVWFALPMIAYILFPRQWVAERLATRGGRKTAD